LQKVENRSALPWDEMTRFQQEVDLGMGHRLRQTTSLGINDLSLIAYRGRPNSRVTRLPFRSQQRQSGIHVEIKSAIRIHVLPNQQCQRSVVAGCQLPCQCGCASIHASDRRLGAPPPVGMKERYKLRLGICDAFGKVASGIGSPPVNTVIRKYRPFLLILGAAPAKLSHPQFVLLPRTGRHRTRARLFRPRDRS
jgi:hypothetical protein